MTGLDVIAQESHEEGEVTSEWMQGYRVTLIINASKQ